VEKQVFHDRQARIKALPLRDSSYESSYESGVRERVHARDMEVPRCRLDETSEDPVGCGLACPVGTQQAENLSALDSKTNSAERARLTTSIDVCQAVSA
jgi:hypothetical protein